MINRNYDILTMDLKTLKEYLKVDYDDDDTLIEICWHAAVSHLETLIQCNFITMNKEGEKIPYEVTLAALLLTTTFYEQRNMTYIPKSAKTSIEMLIRPHFRYGSHWDNMVIKKEEVNIPEKPNLVARKNNPMVFIAAAKFLESGAKTSAVQQFINNKTNP